MKTSFLRVCSSIILTGLVFVFFTGKAEAVQVTFAQDTTLNLAGPNLNLTILAGSKADSLSVESTFFNINVAPGELFSITVPSGYTMANTIGLQEMCNSNGTRTLNVGSAGDRHNAVVTPTATSNACITAATTTSGTAVATGGGGSGTGSASSGTVGSGSGSTTAQHGAAAETPQVSSLTPAASTTEVALAPTQVIKQTVTVKSDVAQVVIPRGVKISADSALTVNAPVELTKDETPKLRLKKTEEIVKAVKMDLSEKQVVFSKKAEVLLPLKNKRDKVTVYTAFKGSKKAPQKVASKIVTKIVDGRRQYFVSIPVKKLNDGQTFVLTKKK